MRRALVIASALAMAATGAAFAACNADDNGTGPNVDSGSPDATGPGEDANPATSDGSAGTDSSPPPGDDAGADATGNPDAAGGADANDGASTADANDANVASDASDADTAADANDGATPADAGGADANDAAADGGASVTLTVKNYFSWCSVAINGGTAFTGPSGNATVAGGSTATIVATPLTGFQIGADPWFGINQNDGGAAPGVDNGSGATETSTGTVTIAAGPGQCVSVCCQEPGNAPVPCPTADPCP
jgi:hypothetical protein